MKFVYFDVGEVLTKDFSDIENLIKNWRKFYGRI